MHETSDVSTRSVWAPPEVQSPICEHGSVIKICGRKCWFISRGAWYYDVISVNLRTSSLIFCGVWTKLSRFMLVLGSIFLRASEISPVDDGRKPLKCWRESYFCGEGQSGCMWGLQVAWMRSVHLAQVLVGFVVLPCQTGLWVVWMLLTTAVLYLLRIGHGNVHSRFTTDIYSQQTWYWLFSVLFFVCMCILILKFCFVYRIP